MCRAAVAGPTLRHGDRQGVFILRETLSIPEGLAVSETARATRCSSPTTASRRPSSSSFATSKISDLPDREQPARWSPNRSALIFNPRQMRTGDHIANSTALRSRSLVPVRRCCAVKNTADRDPGFRDYGGRAGHERYLTWCRSRGGDASVTLERSLVRRNRRSRGARQQFRRRINCGLTDSHVSGRVFFNYEPERLLQIVGSQVVGKVFAVWAQEPDQWRPVTIGDSELRTAAWARNYGHQHYRYVCGRQRHD